MKAGCKPPDGNRAVFVHELPLRVIRCAARSGHVRPAVAVHILPIELNPQGRTWIIGAQVDRQVRSRHLAAVAGMVNRVQEPLPNSVERVRCPTHTRVRCMVELEHKEASVMGKPFRIDDDRLVRALEEGTEIVIVGRRRFRLVEVEGDNQVEGDFYEPTDPDEIRALEEALHDDSEPMGAEEGRNYLKDRLRQHGIG